MDSEEERFEFAGMKSRQESFELVEIDRIQKVKVRIGMRDGGIIRTRNWKSMNRKF